MGDPMPSPAFLLQAPHESIQALGGGCHYGFSPLDQMIPVSHPFSYDASGLVQGVFYRHAIMALLLTADVPPSSPLANQRDAAEKSWLKMQGVPAMTIGFGSDIDQNYGQRKGRGGATHFNAPSPGLAQGRASAAALRP